MYNQIPYMMPVNNALPAAGGATSILKRINWSSLLSNAQKTLNVVNQAVPLYYQVKPMFKNLRTIGRIGREFSKLGNNTVSNPSNPNNEDISNNQNLNNFENSDTYEEIPKPQFFI